MPRLRTAQKNNLRLYALLMGRDVTASALSKTLGVCDNTARKKLRNPGLLTVDELKLVGKSFAIPVDEIREALFKER